MCPPPLNNIFPQSLSNDQIVADNFKIGCVLRFYCKIANKVKRFIFIAEKYDKTTIALLHINSELNTNIFYSEALKHEQLFMTAEGRPFLDHDSYVCCSNLVVQYRADIEAIFKKNISVHLGSLSDEDLKTVRQMIINSKVITRRQKKDFGCSL